MICVKKLVCAHIVYVELSNLDKNCQFSVDGALLFIVLEQQRTIRRQ